MLTGFSKLLAAAAVVLCSSACTIVDRSDVMAAYMVCGSKYGDFRVLEADLKKRGVKFNHQNNGKVLVGYGEPISVHWLCEVSLDSAGQIISIRDFQERRAQ